MNRRPDTGIGAPAGDAPTPWFLTATTMAAVPWLARLRAARTLVDLTVVTVALLFPTLDLPLRRVWPLLVATAFLSGATAHYFSQRQPLPRALTAADLLVQPLLLTELLELTGGPFNPFAVVYAVPIALARLTLGSAWGACVAGVTAGGYALLAYWHLTELVPGHHRLNDFPTHLFTMWVSLAITAELAAYFLVQASNALARREQQIEVMRSQAARSERLASLTTLAAGAAHELSTPLATIAVAARELERTTDERTDLRDIADDVRLIRAEVDRCRAILDQMSGRAGGMAADPPELLSLSSVVNEVRSRMPQEHGSRLEMRIEGTVPPVVLPRSGLVQALHSLVANALDATGPGDRSPVVLHVRRTEQAVVIDVVDSGPGMTRDVLRRAGEPFYTTKDAGRGLGLGLFLARVFAERLGGSLSLQSGDGTTATLRLPLSPYEEASA